MASGMMVENSDRILREEHSNDGVDPFEKYKGQEKIVSHFRAILHFDYSTSQGRGCQL